MDDLGKPTKCESCAADLPEGETLCSVCTTPLLGTFYSDDPSPEPFASERVSSSGLHLSAGRFMPGTILAGRYRIVSLLGRGGMGEVYRADDLTLNQVVALKFLPESMETDPRRLQRFLEEVKIARQIAHPNVCRVYDVGEIHGHRFLSMEFIDGEDLGTLLRRIGRLSTSKALEIGQQLCWGLEAAHQEGVLHRDLKPSNLMIDGRGRARITDFGLATLAEEVRSKEIRFGTPAYMSPEQHAAESVSRRSDIYALGLILYKLFTGRSAFEARSPKEYARLHQEVDPEPPSLWLPEIDPAIERMVLRCLSKDPRLRPDSARAVAVALASCAASSGDGVLKTLVVIGGPGVGELAQDMESQGSGQRVSVAESEAAWLFDRPARAVVWALDWQRTAERLKPAARPRIGVHLGEINLEEASGSEESSSSEGQTSVGGDLATIASCLAALARPGQVLLTRGAFDLARSHMLPGFETASWMAHGSYELKDLGEPLAVYEVGIEGKSPLLAPAGSAKARPQMVQETVAGWRPAPGLDLPYRNHWRIKDKLSAGGFGEVWLAVHRKTREHRAFKFCYDTASLRSLRREITLFRLLKEGLGDRPDICRILDWNFDQPPYYIESEYTPGGSLLEFAERRGGLEAIPLAERLEIVAQVASALAAAHSVGVLHKDVKPANVLISQREDGSTQAQLADFGVGLVTQRDRLAQAGITIEGLTELHQTGGNSSERGTRLYMAPELLEGKPTTLQADIYALGVMLYQMVAGDFSRALAAGWDREVDDELLREDISLVIDGSATRRLSDAANLSERLRTLPERHRQAAARRLEKVRVKRRLRYWAAVTAGLALAAVSLRVREQRAIEKADESQRTIERIEGMLQSLSHTYDAGANFTLKQLFDRLVEDGFESSEGQPQFRARMQTFFGENYFNLSEYDKAVELFTAAHEQNLDLHPEKHPVVAKSFGDLARAKSALGRYIEAEADTKEALRLYRLIHKGASKEVAESLLHLGEVQIFLSKYQEATDHARQGYEMFRVLFGDRSLELAQAKDRLSDVLRVGLPTGEEEAERLLRESLEVRRQFADETPALKRDLADTYLRLAARVKKRGKYDEAEGYARMAYEIYQELFADQHADMVTALNILAQIHQARAQYEMAEGYFGKALDVAREVYGTETHLMVAGVKKNMASMLCQSGEVHRSESLYREILADSRSILGEDDVEKSTLLEGLSMALRDQGRYEEAEARLLEALEIKRTGLGSDHPRLSSTHSLLGQVKLRQGEVEIGEKHLRRAYDLHRHLQDDHPQLGIDMAHLADALSQLGRHEEARQLAMDAERNITQSLPDESPIRRQVEAILEQLEARQRS